MPRQHAKGRGRPTPKSRGAVPADPSPGMADEAPEAPDRLEPDPRPRMAPDPAATDMERADERKGGSLQSPPHPDPADAVPGFLEAGDRDAGARLP